MILQRKIVPGNGKTLKALLQKFIAKNPISPINIEKVYCKKLVELSKIRRFQENDLISSPTEAVS